MKFKKIALGALVLTTLGASTSALAVDGTVNVNVNFLDPITVTEVQPVDFGNLSLPGGNGDTCVMDNAAGITGTLCGAGTFSGTQQIGLVNVTSTDGVDINVTAPSASTATLQFDADLYRADLTAVANPTTANSPADEDFIVAGTLTMLDFTGITTGVGEVVPVTVTVVYN